MFLGLPDGERPTRQHDGWVYRKPVENGGSEMTAPGSARRTGVRTFLLVASLMAAVVPQAATAATQAVEIPVDEGVYLRGDLTLPDGPGPFATVLEMTPYHARPGYQPGGLALLLVDVRGTGASDGAHCLLCDRERTDAHKVIEWIASQPWSNGKVGMGGVSYSAILALMAADRAPEALKAIVPIFATSDLYREMVWHNGLFLSSFVGPWSAFQTGTSLSGVTAETNMAQRSASTNPFESRLHEWNDDWFRDRSVYPRHDRIRVPTLLVDGWYDGFSRGALDNFNGIASDQKWLLMGPWNHSGNSALDAAPPYPPDGFSRRMNDTILTFLDEFLRGTQHRWRNSPRVQYFDLATHKWAGTSTWPPTGTTVETMHLGRGTTHLDGTIRAKAPKGDGAKASTYVYDPSIGVADTFSKWGSVAFTPHTQPEQRLDQVRSLTYSTEVLTEPLRLAGPMELQFSASTTATDMAFIVKVSDVAPDGKPTVVTSGYVRATHRTWDPARSEPGAPFLPNTEPAEVKQGARHKYRIDIWPTATTIQPGHRLRIEIASSDVPSHEPLPYAGVNTIFHNGGSAKLIMTTLPGEPTIIPKPFILN